MLQRLSSNSFSLYKKNLIHKRIFRYSCINNLRFRNVNCKKMNFNDDNLRTRIPNLMTCNLTCTQCTVQGCIQCHFDSPPRICCDCFDPYSYGAMVCDGFIY